MTPRCAFLTLLGAGVLAALRLQEDGADGVGQPRHRLLHRARGGEVVFVRPPSAPELRVNEEAQVPKARGWNHLLSNTKSAGIHVDDLPAAQGLSLPEWSHLNRKCATVFTDAYVRRLAELTPRLKLRADAPRHFAEQFQVVGREHGHLHPGPHS